MKRVFAFLAAAVLLAAPSADAQSRLQQLKEKANNAIKGAIVDKVTDKVTEMAVEKATEKVTGKISEKVGIDINAMAGSDNGIAVPDSRETLQPKRSSTFGWDGKVTPSKAEFPVPLMNEFPSVPSAAMLANPSEAEQIAYYMAIKAVTLRAEELNSDTTCEDSFTEQWRSEAEKAVQDAFGITEAEMKALNEGTLSPEAQEALENRMRAKMFGGVDLAELEEQAGKSEGMTEADVENMAYAASAAVFDRHDAELRKYFNISAEEYKKAAQESMKTGSDKTTKALEKKAEAYMKTLDAATQKQAGAFKASLQKELMQAAMNAIPGAGSALEVARNMGNIQDKLSPIVERMQKTQKYTNAIMAAWPASTWSDADARFSDSERKKVESIKEKIYASDDPGVYNALYLQAMDLIKTYRERAAKVWAADVQARYGKIKDGMLDIIKIQRQAVADGIIPECALWRAPLNLVIEAGDILAEAYSEFPCNYPHMYLEEIVREIQLKEGESPWWPEFHVSSNLGEVLSGNNIFKESEGKVYKFNKGQWTLVPDDYGKNVAAKETKPAGASWKSSDGKREVVYNAEGGFLHLPEGDIIYPAAWAKEGNKIVWAENLTEYKEDGSVTYRIVKCTYKL